MQNVFDALNTHFQATRENYESILSSKQWNRVTKCMFHVNNSAETTAKSDWKLLKNNDSIP